MRTPHGRRPARRILPVKETLIVSICKTLPVGTEWRMEVLEITRQQCCKLPRGAASVLFTSSPLRFLLPARLQEAASDNNSKRGTKNNVLEEK